MQLVNYYVMNKPGLNQCEFDKWFATIPDYWIHAPDLRDKYGNTAALKLSQFGIIPPE